MITPRPTGSSFSELKRLACKKKFSFIVRKDVKETVINRPKIVHLVSKI